VNVFGLNGQGDDPESFSTLPRITCELGNGASDDNLLRQVELPRGFLETRFRLGSRDVIRQIQLMPPLPQAAIDVE
jgi:hypothetical protein